MGTITNFMKKHYLHFNSATLVDAAEAYKKHISKGNKMMVTLAGAMSTAELKSTLHKLIDTIQDSKTLKAIYTLLSS